MKRIYITIYFLSFLASYNTIGAQANCTGTNLPQYTCQGNGSGEQICSNALLSTPSITNSTNLPNIEYALVDPLTIADDRDLSGVPMNLGGRIFGIVPAGEFNPASFGITSGESFQLIPIAYDLNQFKLFVDLVLGGSNCCTTIDSYFSQLCTGLNNINVQSGSDINSLLDILTLIRVMGFSGTISLPGLVGAINTSNNVLSTLDITCGGSSIPFCYSTDTENACNYTYYIAPQVIDVIDNTPLSLEIQATISTGETLEYSLDGTNWQDSPTFDGGSLPVIGDAHVRSKNSLCTASQEYSISNEIPVDLRTFSARVVGTSNHLEWSTELEVNNAFFTLERSVDGVNYEPLTIVEGAINSNNYRQYDYIDDSPIAGINFYRLGHISTDFLQTYSKVISLERPLVEGFQLIDVYPNPVKDEVTIAFTAFEAGEATYSLFDPSRKKILEGTLDVTPNINNLRLDFSPYVGGIYLFVVEMGEYGTLTRILKMD